jgi:hypothetical protein
MIFLFITFLLYFEVQYFELTALRMEKEKFKHISHKQNKSTIDISFDSNGNTHNNSI